MTLFYIALKDLVLVLRDKKALLILVAMPIILTGILGFALGGMFSISDTGLPRGRIAVAAGVPEADPPYKSLVSGDVLREIEAAAGQLDLQKIFVEDFLERPEVKKVVDYRLMDRNQAMKELADSQVDAVVLLPDNFSGDYVMGKNITIKIVSNTGSAVKKSVINGVVRGFADALSIPRIGLKVLAEEMVNEGVGKEAHVISGEKIKGLVQSSSAPLEFKHFAEKGRKPVSALQYYGAAMGVMFILFTAGLAAFSFIEERQEMTMGRLVLSGRRKWEIIAGKGLATLMVALLQMTVMIGFTCVVLGVDWGGDLPALILLTLVTAYSVAGLGVLVASLARTRKAAELFQALVVQMMALLGGSSVPVYFMPDFMRAASGFTINGRALSGYLRLMEGSGLHEISAGIIFLAVAGTVFLAAGGLTMKFEQGRQP